MCDKLIHKYQNWPGPRSTSLQDRPEVTEATFSLSVALASILSSVLLRVAFRAGVVFKRQ